MTIERLRIHELPKHIAIAQAECRSNKEREHTHSTELKINITLRLNAKMPSHDANKVMTLNMAFTHGQWDTSSLKAPTDNKRTQSPPYQPISGVPVAL